MAQAHATTNNVAPPCHFLSIYSHNLSSTTTVLFMVVFTEIGEGAFSVHHSSRLFIVQTRPSYLNVQHLECIANLL